MPYILPLTVFGQGQGRGSHSARGANAPPTFGPMEPRWEHAPPTFVAVKFVDHTVIENVNFHDLH